MRNWKGLLVLLSVVALASAANAQGVPTIGVYWDAAGTQTALVAPYTSDQGYTNPLTAYVLATHTEQAVGGAAFQLVLPPEITLMGAEFPAGIQVGTLQEGIQVGMTNCYFGYYDQPVLVATLHLSTGTHFMTEAPITITNYPPEGALQLADCFGYLSNPQGHTSTLTVYPPTKLGVYWDLAGTESNKISEYGGNEVTYTAYILATDTEQTVGGVAFQLQVDPLITVTGATYPAGIQVGTLAEGIQVGFTNCYFGFYGQPVLVSTLTLWAGENLINRGELNILPYPSAGVVQLSDCQGYLRNIAGGGATLTIPVPTESKSWGQVKNLYGR